MQHYVICCWWLICSESLCKLGLFLNCVGIRNCPNYYRRSNPWFTNLTNNILAWGITIKSQTSQFSNNVKVSNNSQIKSLVKMILLMDDYVLMEIALWKCTVYRRKTWKKNYEKNESTVLVCTKFWWNVCTPTFHKRGPLSETKLKLCSTIPFLKHITIYVYAFRQKRIKTLMKGEDKCILKRLFILDIASVCLKMILLSHCQSAENRLFVWIFIC